MQIVANAALKQQIAADMQEHHRTNILIGDHTSSPKSAFAEETYCYESWSTSGGGPLLFLFLFPLLIFIPG